MTESDVVHLAVEAMFTTFKLVAPILGVSLAVGLIISMFQSVTQILEFTPDFRAQAGGGVARPPLHRALDAQHADHLRRTAVQPDPAAARRLIWTVVVDISVSIAPVGRLRPRPGPLLAWLLIVPPFGNRAVMPTIVTIGLAMSLALVAAPHVVGPTSPTLPASSGQWPSRSSPAPPWASSSGVLLSAHRRRLPADLFGGIVLPPSVDPLSANQTPMLGQF